MTREEREKALEVWYDIRFDNEKFEKARKISIKALEQESCITETEMDKYIKNENPKLILSSVDEDEYKDVLKEPCGDAISREDAIKAFADMRDGYPKFNGDMIPDYMVAKTLKELPSVTPSRRKGYWISNNGYIWCSECNFKNSKRPNFCENCGAEMESKE